MERPIDLSALAHRYENSQIVQNMIPYQDKTIVLVVGHPQAGKSTFINFLSGVSLIANQYRQILTQYPNQGLRIGDEPCSCTLTPQIVEIDDLVYIDCPGFAGTNTDTELLSIYQIVQCLSMCKKLKILLVASFNLYARLDIHHVDYYNQFFEFLDYDLTNIKDSVRLVITKIDNERLPYLQKRMKMGIQDYELNAQQTAFIEHITDFPLYFYAPDDLKLNNTEQDRIIYLSIINNLTPMDLSTRKFNPVISGTLHYQLFQQLMIDIETSNESFENLQKAIVDQGKERLDQIQNLLLRFQKQNYCLFQLMDILQTIQQWIQSYNYPIEIEQSLFKFAKKLEFLKPVTYSFQEYQSAFEFQQIFLDKLQKFGTKSMVEVKQLERRFPLNSQSKLICVSKERFNDAVNQQTSFLNMGMWNNQIQEAMLPENENFQVVKQTDRQQTKEDATQYKKDIQMIKKIKLKDEDLSSIQTENFDLSIQQLEVGTQIYPERRVKINTKDKIEQLETNFKESFTKMEGNRISQEQNTAR